MAVVLKAERFSPLEKTKETYKDILTAFGFSDNTKDLVTTTNENAVKQSIINIMLTNVGEKIYNPTFGSYINKLLFENVSPQTTAALIDVIKNSIENFEPRANLIDVVVSPMPDDNAYTVSIVFSIINNIEPITLEFLLNRVR